MSQLVDSVLQHYRNNVWPIINAIVHSRLSNPFDLALIFEGSAMLPEFFSASRDDGVEAVWLTSPENLIAERIKQNSQIERRSVREKDLIEAFLDRTMAIDRFLLESLEPNAQRWLDSSSPDVKDAIKSIVLEDS